MRPGQPDIIAAGADGFVAAAPDLVAGFEREARERAERARQAFEAFMATHGLPRAGQRRRGGGLCADWRIESPAADAVLGSWGAVFDLLVMGRPLPDAVSPSMAALGDGPVRERAAAADRPAAPARQAWARRS